MNKKLAVAFAFCFSAILFGIETKEELIVKLKAGIQQADTEKVKGAVTQNSSILQEIVPGIKIRRQDQGKKPLEFALEQKLVNADIILYLLENQPTLNESLLGKLFATNNEPLIKKVVEEHSTKLPADHIVFKRAMALKNASLIDYLLQKKFNITPEQATNLLFFAIQNKVSLAFITALIEQYNASLTMTKTYKNYNRRYQHGSAEIFVTGATPLFFALIESSNAVDYLISKLPSAHIKDTSFALDISWCTMQADYETTCSSLNKTSPEKNFKNASYLTAALLGENQKGIDLLAQKGLTVTPLDVYLNKWVTTPRLGNVKNYKEINEQEAKKKK